ncbi:MAG TPA: hypothetical protein PLC86_23100, partial [Candidatus Accumulibacter phosphatis]|nr:hypothetical protein [Candidatus Accumulibacter phosphatis]
AGIEVPQVYLTPLQEWSRQVSHQISRSSSVDGALESGAEAKTGLPLVGSLFARLTTAIRSNSTWKTEIREQVRNSFSDLARRFNQLLSFVEDELGRQGRARALIFVVDGTDRLRGDEADAFFICDIHQLRQLRADQCPQRAGAGRSKLRRHRPPADGQAGGEGQRRSDRRFLAAPTRVRPPASAG